MNLRLIVRSALSVTAIAILTLVAPSVRAESDVPFKGTFAGTFAIDPATLQLQFAGGGPASHLGASAIVGASQLMPSGPGCFEIVTDTVTLTADNGDQLVLTNSGQDCFDETGRIIGMAAFTVTGGTGRFAGATGTGTTEVVATPNETGLAGTFVLTLSGRISY
jgi:hypothetical protein